MRYVTFGDEDPQLNARGFEHKLTIIPKYLRATIQPD